MKSKLVQIFLLCAMTFNVLHAFIMIETSSHECHTTQVEKHSDTQACGEFCDIHHLFHLSAIIPPFTEFIPLSFSSLKPDTNHLGFHPLFYENAHKPPIV